jgi:DHA2 family methylenomycin A resistance protein-like MFS transporter
VTGQRPAFAKSLTLAAMSLGFGVVQLDVTIVNTALSSIGHSLGGGVSELQWVVSAYTIAFAALILTAGALGDRVGAKKIFMAGFALFTVASVACAVAHSAAILIASRAAQGVGAAILVPNSLALLNYAYPDEKERGRAVGIWAAGASLALTAGPLAGGALIALVGWRSIFLVNLPIGLAGLWLTWRYASETPRSRQRELDLPGQAAAIGALGCLAGALIEGGARGWSNPWVLAGFATFVALAGFFIFQERSARQPMLPLSLFKHRLFALTSLIGLLVNAAFYGLIFVLSLYFQQINGLSALATGLDFLPMMAAVLVVNLFAARAAERFGALMTIAAGAGIAAAGLHRTDRYPGRHRFWGGLRAAARDGSWARATGAAAHFDAAGQRREVALRRRRWRSQLHQPDRQRAGRRPVWIAAGAGRIRCRGSRGCVPDRALHRSLIISTRAARNRCGGRWRSGARVTNITRNVTRAATALSCGP